MSRSRWALTDLGLLVAFVLGVTAVLLVPGVPWQLEWAFGIPLVLVVPGYAVVAALFPADPSVAREETGQPDPPGLAARVAMTLTISAVIVAAVGVLLSRVELFRLESVVLGLGGVSIVGALVAGVRRRGLPVPERADPLAVASSQSIPDLLGISGLQTITLLVATLALVGAVGVLGANPATQSSFSEVSVLADGDTDEFLGSDEPVTLVGGQENTMYLRISNHEGESIDYGVVGRLQQVGPNGTVSDSQRIGAESITVEDGETVDLEQRIDPSMTGDTLRLQYLIYTGPIADDPRPGNADLSVRHWVEAVDGGET
jgi:uncharacterized membrane protein